MSESFSYFDETYFERGKEKGTSYSDYKESALKSPIFLEIAEAIKSVFQPTRVLEIGCATGVIIRHLNNLGIEAHGIDVSEWAVKNREHPNVSLQSAHDLNFPDAHFDLVISAHALEHIPVDLKNAAFAEISRVSAGGLHFHMLPILGDGPYVGDETFHIQQLQRDPTHVLLHDRKWWVNEWKELGWRCVPLNILFSQDNSQFECSTSQIVFSNKEEDIEISTRAFEWNRRVAKGLFQSANRPDTLPLGRRINNPDQINYKEEISWSDHTYNLRGIKDLRDGFIFGIVEVDGDQTLPLRFAAICQTVEDAETGVYDRWQTFEPGINIVEFFIRDMNPSSGTPSLSSVNALLFGGPGQMATVKTQLALRTNGSIIPLEPA